MSDPFDPFDDAPTVARPVTPPPPGQPPHVPPTPPVTPPAYTPPPAQYPPTQQPPAQYPPTQQMPPAGGQYPPAGGQYPPAGGQYPPAGGQYPPAGGQYPPAGGQYPPAGGQYPPTQAYPTQPPQNTYGYSPSAPAPAPKKKTGLIVGGGLAAAALAVVGVVVFTGGDDKKPTTLGGDDTTSITQVTKDTTDLTVVITNPTVVEDTFVITAPPVTDPPITDVPPVSDAGGGIQTLTDDTSLFSVVLPSDFEVDTSSFSTNSGATVPRVMGSTDLNAFGDDDDTFGISVMEVPTTLLATAADALGAFAPDDTTCTQQTTEIGFTTAQGPTEVLRADGCGTDGKYAKVIMAIATPDGQHILVALAQGIGPSSDTLLSFTQAVFETAHEV